MGETIETDPNSAEALCGKCKCVMAGCNEPKLERANLCVKHSRCSACQNTLEDASDVHLSGKCYNCSSCEDDCKCGQHR
jgi:hypothetical protein